jgi:deoxycytidine triphosphate deaminase/intein/homing endonuclease
MAAATGMIEPFSPEQVRVANGHKIVSYGTSSYGYDVRCADEFKIFTNINSTIVDPKSFDEKSFVDFKGPVCIIPPNSFALASTVEFFRIPRSVLTVCLGKCVTGDTRVVDADTGAYVPITEMRWGKSTLALDSGRLKAAKVSAFIPQGKKAVFELRTQAGLRIRATENHPFLKLNGWAPLSDLRAGDRIAAARDIPVFGKTSIPDWEASLLGLMISQAACDTPGHSPTYTTADPIMVSLLEGCMKDSAMGVVRFNGMSGYRLGERTHSWLEKYQLDVGAAARFVPQSIFTAPESSVRLFLQSLFSGDGSVDSSKEGAFLEYCSQSRRLIEELHHLLLRFGVCSLIREKTTAVGTRACKIQITDKDQIRRFAERIGFIPSSLQQRRLDVEVLPMIRTAEAWPVIGMAARVAGVTSSSFNRRTQSDQPAPFFASAKTAPATEALYLSSLVEGPMWDVVESIESAGAEEVFDISVPTLHNFVANDLIVHNSTYARCFSGDTRVALVDGTAPTLEEMATRHGLGELFWGYSIGQNGRLIVSLLDAPRYIGRDALLEVELDNGERIHATPDHLFMRRNGRMTAAHALRPSDALMPLYRDLFRGYEMVYQPLDGYLYPTHRLADEWNLAHEIYNEVPGTHRHQMDFDRYQMDFDRCNNRPSNIQRLEAPQHIRPHNSETYGKSLDTEEHGSAISAALTNPVADPPWWQQFSRAQSRRATGCRGTPAYRNHKVVAVREIAGDHDVYCLTVPEAGNFALQGGVFVKNCGIIVNVTPLEPEWEGHVTLEFSNTTPLPAKIYANEGVAQMLFFESDEVCETSYRDRGGKYQGQRGVTLPKT